MYTYSQIHSMSGSDVAATFGMTAQSANALRQMAKAQIVAGKGDHVYTPRGTANPAAAGVKRIVKERRTSELEGPLMVALNAALYGLCAENTATAVREVMEDDEKRERVTAMFAVMPGLNNVDNALAEVDAWSGVRTPEQRRQQECERIYQMLCNAKHEAENHAETAEALRKAGWNVEPPPVVGLRLGIDVEGCANAVSIGDIGALKAMVAHCGL